MPTKNSIPKADRSARRRTRAGLGHALRRTLLVGALSAPTLPLALPATASPSTTPVEIVFVLDNSGSMREHDPAFRTRDAVLDFTDALAVRAREQSFDARVAVLLFDEDVEVALPLTSLSTAPAPATEAGASTDSTASPRVLLAPALAALDYSGLRTRSADGVERALYALRSSERGDARQAIVFLTDGKIDTGDPARDREASAWLRGELAAEARERGIQVFGLAFTESADYQLLQSVARQTDADYYRALQADQLSEIASRILSRMTAEDGVEVAVQTGRPSAQERATSAALPDVSAASLDASRTAAPHTDEARENGIGSTSIGRLAWLPLAILLVGGGLWGYRRRLARSSARSRTQAASSAAPVAQLLDVGGVLGETGRAIALVPGRTRIGRDAHNEIVIRDDTISSEHAVIELEGGRYWLEDLRSTNGTKHRDTRLAAGQRVALKGGDHIRFADVDLMFVAAGYVPGGATVVLPSTSTPPSHWRKAERSSKPGGSTPALRESAKPVFEAASGELFRECLDYHLARVDELSPAFARFVARAFDDEMRSALCLAAGELVKTAHREDRLAERVYTHDHIRYVVCGAPGGMDVAAKAYQTAHGGFSRFLTEQVESESFRADRCEILSVLSFGRAAGAPWVTLSIVPAEGQEPQIDLLSFELLSEAERRAIRPEATREVSRSGLR